MSMTMYKAEFVHVNVQLSHFLSSGWNSIQVSDTHLEVSHTHPEVLWTLFGTYWTLSEIKGTILR
jgi:hypothetical protein